MVTDEPMMTETIPESTNQLLWGAWRQHHGGLSRSFCLSSDLQLIRHPQLGESRVKGKKTAQYTRVPKIFTLCPKVGRLDHTANEACSKRGCHSREGGRLLASITFLAEEPKGEGGEGGRSGHKCSSWRDQLFSQKENWSDWRKGKGSRQTQRADSVSCFLSPGGNRTAHTPLGLPRLMIPLSGHGYIQSPKC